MIVRFPLAWLPADGASARDGVFTASLPRLPEEAAPRLVLEECAAPARLHQCGAPIGGSQGWGGRVSFGVAPGAPVRIELAPGAVPPPAYVLARLPEPPSDGDFPRASVESPLDFIVESVWYRMEFSDALVRMDVHAEADIRSWGSRSLALSLDVDGHELCPSARVALADGDNRVCAPPVAVIRPRLWWPAPLGRAHMYQMRLRLAAGAGRAVARESLMGACVVRPCPGGSAGGGPPEALEVNGTQARCLPAAGGVASDGAAAAVRLRPVRLPPLPPSERLAAMDSEGVLFWSDAPLPPIEPGAPGRAERDDALRLLRRHPCASAFLASMDDRPAAGDCRPGARVPPRRPGGA